MNGLAALALVVGLLIYVATMKPDKGDRRQAREDARALKALKRK